MEDLKKFYLKYKIILWPVVTAVSSLIILGFVVIPQFLAYLHTQGELTQLQVQTDSLTAKAQVLQNIDDQNIKDNLQVAFTVLPVDEDIPDTVVSLQNLAIRDSLSVQNLNFASSGDLTKTNNSVLKLSLVGSKTAIWRFFQDLQSSPGIYKVQSIKANSTGSGDNFEIDLPVAIYFDSNSEASVSLDAPVPQLNSSDQELLRNLSKSIQGKVVLQAGSQSGQLSIPLGKDDPFK